MNALRVNILLLSLCACLLPACTSKPECTSDRDCHSKYSEQFLCYRNKCHNQNTLELGNILPDANQPDKTDPPQDRPAEKTPEPKTETRPEPTPELPKEQPTPDTPSQNGLRGLHEPCQTHFYAPNNERCKAGFLCLKTSATKSFCFQDCSGNESICTGNQDGRDNCMLLKWSTDDKPLSICVKHSKKDESCDPQQSNYCTPNATNHLVCQQGKCVAGTLCQSLGCACGPQQNPPGECDPSKKLICSDTGKCVTGIRAFEGEACNNELTPRRVCEANHVCVRFGDLPIPSICLKLCDLKNPISSCAHRTGFACSPLDNSGRGACLKDACDTQDDCQFKDPPNICGGASATKKFCVPIPPAGPIGYGQLCDNLNPAKRCKPPFHCLLSSGKKTGYCSLQCKNDLDCQTHEPTSGCTLINRGNNLRFCGWGCSAPKKCPSQLTCQGTICLGP